MRASKLMTVLVLGVALASAPAFAKKDKEKKGEATTPPAASTGDVAAYLGDEPISRAEVDKTAAAQLTRIRLDEYNIRRSALDQIVQKKLQEREAQARGVSLADLLKAEIDDKAGSPTADEIKDFYEKNKARMQGRTQEQAAPDIEKSLRQQKIAVRRAAFAKELQDKAKLRVLLDPPRANVNVPADWPVKGPAMAPVTFVEFSDYQCPFCRRADPVVNQILAEYGDKIRYAHRDYPLSFHPRAMPASRAAHCALDQGLDKYWSIHKNLMTEAGDLGDDDLKKRAQAVGLDTAAFAACYGSTRHTEKIQASFDDGASLGVTGTPSFFINGRMIVGAKPVEEFKQIIDEEIARAATR